MRRFLALVAVLALAGCGVGGGETSVPAIPGTPPPASGIPPRRLPAEAARARQMMKLDPGDPRGYISFIVAENRLAGIDGYDDPSGTYTAKGKHELGEVVDAWRALERLHPAVAVAGPAALSAGNAYRGRGELSAAIGPARVRAAYENTTEVFEGLAQIAYEGLDEREARAAVRKAIELAPPSHRRPIRQRLRIFLHHP